MAHIQKMKGKNTLSYKIFVSCGRDEQNKQIVKTTTYKPTSTTPSAITKEVKKYADEFEKRVKEGKFLEGDKTTFSDFIKVWEQNWASEHLTVGVKEGYIDILNRRVCSYIGGMKLSKINSVLIESILSDMKKEQKAVKTIKRTFTAINSVFKYAFRKGVIEENPCIRVELPSQKVKNMENPDSIKIQCFDLKQAKTFLNALKIPYSRKIKPHDRIAENGTHYHVDEYIQTEYIPIKFQTYFTLAIYSGFRRGEMLALTWDDINFHEHTVNINKAVALTNEGQVIKSPKTYAGYRNIKLPKECFTLLYKLRKEQREEIMKQGTHWKGCDLDNLDKNYLFTQADGNMMDVATPRHRFISIIKDYNSMIEEKISNHEATEEDKLPMIRLHDLRHTSASLLIASGVDPVTVANRLGHKDVAVTLNTYSHALKAKDDSASGKLEELFG